MCFIRRRRKRNFQMMKRNENLRRMRKKSVFMLVDYRANMLECRRWSWAILNWNRITQIQSKTRRREKNATMRRVKTITTTIQIILGMPIRTLMLWKTGKLINRRKMNISTICRGNSRPLVLQAIKMLNLFHQWIPWNPSTHSLTIPPLLPTKRPSLHPITRLCQCLTWHLTKRTINAASPSQHHRTNTHFSLTLINLNSNIILRSILSFNRQVTCKIKHPFMHRNQLPNNNNFFSTNSSNCNKCSSKLCFSSNNCNCRTKLIPRKDTNIHSPHPNILRNINLIITILAIVLNSFVNKTVFLCRCLISSNSSCNCILEFQSSRQ